MSAVGICNDLFYFLGRFPWKASEWTSPVRDREHTQAYSNVVHVDLQAACVLFLWVKSCGCESFSTHRLSTN
jgi:hypothetical protein